MHATQRVATTSFPSKLREDTDPKIHSTSGSPVSVVCTPPPKKKNHTHSHAGVKNFGDAYLLDTTLWEWSRGPEFLLGTGEAGLRVGHTALLARAPHDNNDDDGNDSHGRDAEAAAAAGAEAEAEAGSGDKMTMAMFGGQDGAGVRSSELALLLL